MLSSMKNCVKCRKIFHYINDPRCDDCLQEERDTYERVREHLKENPSLNLLDLAKETEVSPKKIARYIKEGKLELMNAEIPCEKCGSVVKTGRFCQSCVEGLAKATMTMVNKFKDSDSKGASMRTGRDSSNSNRTSRF